MGRWALAGAATLIALALLAQACTTLPPRDLENACAILGERTSWRDAAAASAAQWGISQGTILAVIHQESRFRATARPGWRMWFGVIPAGQRSSAFGYGQVKTGTWNDYRERQDQTFARRDRFEDVADFIGWYADVIHRAASVAKDDAFHLYLGYHEGPSGVQRRTFDQKPWLLGVARRVSERAARYDGQLAGCPG